jgi:hypothetical protein
VPIAADSVLAHASGMDTNREPSAQRHPTRAERTLRQVRRHAIAGALIVGGVGLAAADVSVGIGWGLVLAGAALAVQPYSGPPREGSPQDSATARTARRALLPAPAWSAIPARRVDPHAPALAGRQARRSAFALRRH